MSYWQDLVTSNPMLVEVKRYANRLQGVTRNRVVNIVVILLIAAFYMMYLWSILSTATPTPMAGHATIMLIVICGAMPALLHGSIAGERERGTWDLLAVTPLSSAQIVIGKFALALIVIGVILALGALPMLLSFLGGDGSLTEMGRLMLICGGFGVLISAYTLALSARIRKPVGVLVTSYLTIFVCLVIAPGMLTAMMVGADSYAATETLLTVFHPFVAVFSSGDPFYYPSGEYQTSVTDWMHFPVNLTIGSLFMTGTYRALKRTRRS